ncbi:Dolichyl-diphosphooligosaccharide-protein glycosyltransferase subunit dad1 [Pyricularia grisea]|nr:Dolichyl-diphosphooligosaccharide-protein glycosyltransferase subunit dad1 [Pyricularia grisea]
MAPKRAVTPSRQPAAPAVAATPTPAKAPKASSSSSAATWDKTVTNVVNHYLKSTPQRIKLLDVFLGFLVVNGALQFLYCILAGNFPFNAFLSGFCSTVGQFVLTVSLRIQQNPQNASDFPSVSPERAFADYIVCSLILHFFCVNFIN